MDVLGVLGYCGCGLWITRSVTTGRTVVAEEPLTVFFEK
jgi:hypothetical protein